MTIYRCKLADTVTFGAALTAMLVLAGCGRASVNDQRICSPPGRSYLDPLNKRENRKSTEQMVMNEDCIHAWSYRLGKAPGGNREIAEAAVEACSLGILYEANMLIEEQTGEKADRQSEEIFADKLTKRYIRTALFHVVQGRAGQCDIS
jgi:hypothetical protein